MTTPDSPRPTWHTRAACRGLDPDVFFPERGEPVREAKAICATCPVQSQCLAHAIDNVERWGVWGGTTDRQRIAIRKARRWAEGC